MAIPRLGSHTSQLKMVTVGTKHTGVQSAGMEHAHTRVHTHMCTHTCTLPSPAQTHSRCSARDQGPQRPRRALEQRRAHTRKRGARRPASNPRAASRRLLHPGTRHLRSQPTVGSKQLNRVMGFQSLWRGSWERWGQPTRRPGAQTSESQGPGFGSCPVPAAGPGLLRPGSLAGHAWRS